MAPSAVTTAFAKTLSSDEIALNAGIISTLCMETYRRIRGAKVLLVGSGGIGCELVKNLSLMGFRNVEVIDLDDVDDQNLERQFLFRSVPVGQAKVKSLVPSPQTSPASHQSPRVNANHGNVKDKDRFELDFFNQFHFCVNDLDSVDARRHVNRMCLAASLPLIDYGAPGCAMPVTVTGIHPKSGTECYECQGFRCRTNHLCLKGCMRSYSTLTTRPVDCIVWGKELWKLNVSPLRIIQCYSKMMKLFKLQPKKLTRT